MKNVFVNVVYINIYSFLFFIVMLNNIYYIFNEINTKL